MSEDRAASARSFAKQVRLEWAEPGTDPEPGVVAEPLTAEEAAAIGRSNWPSLRVHEPRVPIPRSDASSPGVGSDLTSRSERGQATERPRPSS